jgi:O-antigen/teichoic acid export membrane protein
MFWNATLFPIKALLAILASVIVVRTLGRDMYAVATITATVASIWEYTDLGIGSSLLRFIPEVERGGGKKAVRLFLRNVIGVKMAMVLAAIVVLNLFADPFIEYFKLGDQGLLFLRTISAILILRALSEIFMRVLTAYYERRVTNLLDIVSAVVQPLLTIAFVMAGLGVMGVLLATVVTTVINLLLVAMQASRVVARSAVEGTGELKPRLAKRFALFSGLVYLVNLSDYFNDLPFVVLILSALTGRTDVAIFTLAFNFVMIPLRYLYAPLSGIELPTFASIHAEQNLPKLREAYALVTKFLILIIIPAGCGLTILSPNLIPLLYTESFAASIFVAQLLFILLYIESFIHSPYVILMVYEEYSAVAAIKLLTLASIPLLILLTPRYGAVAAALIIGILRAFARMAMTVWLIRRYHAAFPFQFFAKVLIASLAFVIPLVPLLYILPHTWPSTIVLAAVGALIFLAAFKLQGGFDESEKRRILTLDMPLREAIVRFL